MSTVFISHSSQDDQLTDDLLQWLHETGFRDTFVDHADILGGENWTDRLRDQAAACRVVVCLITGDWLRSSDCFNEFQAAWYMGKSILPLFLVDPDAPGEDEAARRFSRVLAETQGIDLRSAVKGSGPDRQLDLPRESETGKLLIRSLRAVGAHSDIGLDPTAFAIDPVRRPTPFPGLVSFGDDDADAAIFYGRSREIAEAIEELRSMRANADRRPLVILGVSGAGKSSVLKAGIVPRLRREKQTWLPLRVFRPGIDPLGAFAEALSRTLADHGDRTSPGQLRGMLDTAVAAEDDTAIHEALDNLADRLRRAAGAEGATILIGVDQAEELLRAESRASLQLSDCLAAALSGKRGWLIAFTIRTDRFPDLQSHPSFRNLKARGYDLRQLPAFRFSDVIEGPAARYGVALSPELVDALMDDAPEKDALPLLAFALQRLWDQFSAARLLGLDDYRALGGLSGLVSDAAERALAGLAPGDERTAPPSAGQLEGRARLAERCFVPALVDVSESHTATRRVAHWSEFTAEEKDLLRQFEAWRLVVRRGVGDEATVEVAHEALFREWARMRDWLTPEIHRIEVLRGTVDAARQWDLGNRPRVLLNHRGQRLAEARALLADDRYSEHLGAVERAYLAGCADVKRRGVLSYGAAVLIAVAAVGIGIWSYLQSERRMIAEREAAFTARVEAATGAADVSTLESFTRYVMNDPYASTRDDRFDVLREVLTGAQTAIHPEYAIAEYALGAVEIPEGGAFELEYSAERFVDARLFPVLWRPHAAMLARTRGLPAPSHFRLIENPDFPPGRVVIRRSGEPVFDAVLPATDRRHMLDATTLDREELRTFFEANRESFQSATHISDWSEYYYVPDWSVPIWNAGRDRNSNSRVIPPGTDFALLLAGIIVNDPQIVIDELAVEVLLSHGPPGFALTVDEFRAIRGPMARDDVLAWLDAGHDLGDIFFSLGRIAGRGPGAEVGPLAAAHLPVPDVAEPYMHGPALVPKVFGAQGAYTSAYDAGQSEGRKTRGGRSQDDAGSDTSTPLSDEDAKARRARLETRFALLKPRGIPVRILVAPPPQGVARADWPALSRALFRDADAAPTAEWLDALARGQAELFQRTGLVGLDIGVETDPDIPAGQFAVEVLDATWDAAQPVASETPEEILAQLFGAAGAQVTEDPSRFVLPHGIGAYLEAASPDRRVWARSHFAYTDLAQLVAGLIREEARRPEIVAAHGGTSTLLYFDWLIGALVFSEAAYGAQDGAAHLALWRMLAEAATTAPPDAPDDALARRIARGVELLISGDVENAAANFAVAAKEDPDAARAAFLAAYAGAAPKLLFEQIRAECETPTQPVLGDLEARQLEFLLGAFDAGRPEGVEASERVHFELCLLGTQDHADREAWLAAALRFAAGLRAPDQLTPEQALWLGTNIWRKQNPLVENTAPLGVGRRFLLSAVERIDDPDDLFDVSMELLNGCYSRLDFLPCMRRIMGLAEASGKPALGLTATEALSYSIYPEDHARASAMLDLFLATYGAQPEFSGGTLDKWYTAYVEFVRGVLNWSTGKPDSDEWRQARTHFTNAMAHADFRFSVLPILSEIVEGFDGPDAAQALLDEAMGDTALESAPTYDVVNTYFIRFSLAMHTEKAEALLDDLVALPVTSGCEAEFSGDCAYAWIWRALAQVVFRHADWQTVSRTVTARVDHPYATLVALILYAQAGEEAGTPKLLRRKWAAVDPNLWDRRLELGDEGVFREILLGYSVGEIPEGYQPDEVLAILRDPESFVRHDLSRIGMRREEMLTEALFYLAMLEIAEGRVAEGIGLLESTREAGYWRALEYNFARIMLAQLEERSAGQ